MTYKILIVEDDPIIAESVKNYLIKWSYHVYVVEDFRQVIEDFSDYSLAILDISLPFFNGYHWCSEIRKVSNIPIVFLSSASENMNIVMAMNMGADDFISKPFDLEVLTSKITAILRRTYDFNNHINLIVHKELVLNSNDGTILYKDEKIDLTKNEYRILFGRLRFETTPQARHPLQRKYTQDHLDCILLNRATFYTSHLRGALVEAW